VYIRACVTIHMNIWVSLCFSCSTRNRSCNPNSVTGDPNPIRIYARYGPINRRFEDRSMGWSVDQCQFVQWRSDSDSVPKSRYFMWVFLVFLLSILILIYISAF